MNPILLSIWRWIASVGVWLFLNLHMYRAKSALHRWLFDRKYNGTELTVYPTVAALQEWLAKQDWKRDAIDSGWDAVCSPEKIQAVGQGGDHRIGDCDEFAIYIVAAMTKAFGAGQMKEMNVANPRFFTVTWIQRNGVVDGHNVALIERPQPDGSLKYSYMDYGLPSEPPLDTPAQVAVLIASRYAGWDKEGHGSVESGVLCWGVQSLGLMPERTGLGDGWARGVHQKAES